MPGLRIVDVHVPYAHERVVSGPRRVVVHGGLGDPGHSVIALYAPTLLGLGADLVAVDPAAADPARAAAVAAALGVSYVACLTPEQYQSGRSSLPPPDAALVLTPVATHLPILRSYAAGPPPGLVVIEKPAAGLAEVAALGNATAALGRSRCYFIDTAMVADSLEHAFSAAAIDAVGRLRRIIAVGLDNPWIAPRGLEQYALAARESAITARGLLSLRRNGGAGAGLDMGIHAVTGLSVVLDRLGLGIAQVQADSVRLGVADLPGLRRDVGAETHILVGGRIGNVSVVIEGGKGADIWDRRIEVHGERGVCAIGLGTLAHRGYVWLRTAAGETLWRLDSPDTGYANHMSDVAILLGLRRGEPVLAPERSAALMLASLRAMAGWYATAGRDPGEREAAIVREAGHGNQLLTSQEQAVRAHLEVVKQEHLRR